MDRRVLLLAAALSVALTLSLLQAGAAEPQPAGAAETDDVIVVVEDGGPPPVVRGMERANAVRAMKTHAAESQRDVLRYLRGRSDVYGVEPF